MPGVFSPTGGMVCWGSPAAAPPPPASWDPSIPNNYVDCAAYGGYTGTTPNRPGGTNTPTTLPPGDCQRSLFRMIPTTFNNPNPPTGTWADTDTLNDFALQIPTPQNNAGSTGTLNATPDTNTDGEADCRDDDDDGDTVLDVNDNCRVIANLGQTDGDADGAGTPCDPDDAIVDFDQDGCADGEEQDDNNQQAGGKRDATLFWDFFDTPDAAGNRDKVVSVVDISRVVARFGSSTMPPLSKPDALTQALSAPPPAPAYHAGFDRTSPMAGQGAWQTNMPNGSVTVQDITLAVSSFGHSCLAAP
jgi:hypothetical protein